MKKFIMALVLMLSLAVTPAFASVVIEDCDGAVDAGETYLLNVSDGDCGLVAGDITLDCQGNSVCIAVEDYGNITIRNCVFDSCSSRAIDLINSDGNDIYGNYFNYSADVALLIEGGSSNERIHDNSFINNSGVGIFIYDGSLNNSVYNNTFYGNILGVNIQDSSSTNETIYGNVFINNGCGIFYNTGAGGTNLIYNNYFANARNVCGGDTHTDSLWNVTMQAGIGIFGGRDMIGGNYWTNSGICTGEMTPCGNFMESSSCDAQYGCTWNDWDVPETPFCDLSGDDRTCLYRHTPDLCEMTGCAWNTSILGFSDSCIDGDINGFCDTLYDVFGDGSGYDYLPIAHDAPAVQNVTLIHEWSFNEGSGSIAYDSVGSSDGTLVNFSDGWVAGVNGTALAFDSSLEQFIDVGNDSSFNFGVEPFSFGFWYKDSDEYGSSMSVISKGDINSGSYHYEIDADSSFITSNSTVSPVNIVTMSDSQPFGDYNDGQWHFVVVTRNTTDFSLYVDGILNVTTLEIYEDILADVDNSIPFTIGSSYYLGSIINFFNGTLDDVKIWSGSLNSSEVFTLFSEYESPVESSPVECHLYFDGVEGNYSIVGDSLMNLSGSVNESTLSYDVLFEESILISGALGSFEDLAFSISDYGASYGLNNFTLYYAGNESYASCTATGFLEVLPNPTLCSLQLNDVDGNVTVYDSESVLHVLGFHNSTDFESDINLYINGIQFASINDSVIETTQPLLDFNLSYGLNNFTISYAGTLGQFESCSITHYLNLLSAPDVPEETGLSAMLHQAGDGLGVIVSSVTAPLGKFLLYLGIIGGVVGIFMAVAVVIKRSMVKG